VVEWAVYKAYMKAGCGAVVVPLWVLSLVFMQAVNIISSYWYAILLLRFSFSTNLRSSV